MAVRRAVGACIVLGSFTVATPIYSSSNSSSYSFSNSSTYSSSTQSSTAATAATAAATLNTVSEMAYGGPSSNDYHSPAWLPNGEWSLNPALSQSATNGGAAWGTANAPILDQWLNTPGQPMPSGTPWGSASSTNTNYYNNVPNTGMTRSYTFTVSQGTIAPDGVEKQGILVNGQFPGPLIEANWGDWIEVTVTNALPDEGTALHWHGLLQKATPWMDGVPGVQQCPIAPGSTFTYRFQADLYGTTWYHGHYSAQYAGGLLGPLIVHGPNDNDYDVDMGPIILSDWYHKDYLSLVEQVMAPVSENLPPPPSNNNLINGKMNYPCANTTQACTPNAGISKFNFESGKKYRLRLINTSAEAIQKFSIDGHSLKVITNDFVEVQPYDTDVVTLGVGQRSDVIVEATGNSGDAFWMRSSISVDCSVTDGVSPNAVAAIYYENANNSTLPTTNSTVSQADLARCSNDDLSKTQPLYGITPDPNPSTTETMTFTLAQNNTGDDEHSYNLWYVNNSTFRVDYNDPVLLEAKLGNTNFSAESNVYNFGSNKTVRMILENESPISHPLHMHGHNLYILAEGFGTWDGTVTNPSNPQRRDVQIIQAAKDANTPAYVVVQIDMDNPGVWPFHCHMAWHVSGGLYFQLLERPDDIVNDTQIPGVMAQTCRDWTSWTGGHVPDQIDSGL